MTAASIAEGLRARRTGPMRWQARCPAHSDRNPSLSIAERDGKALLHCHAGCPQSSVIDALKSRGLWPERLPSDASPDELRQQARDRRRDAADLATARYWRRAFDALADEALAVEKAALFDTVSGFADVELIRTLTSKQAVLNVARGGAVLSHYREFRAASPRLCSAMVTWARRRERLELVALDAWLTSGELQHA